MTSWRGMLHMTSAMAAMKPTPITQAVHPARVIPGLSPRPSASPTRTVAAWPRPSGTMNVKAASCSATACAATAGAPIQPMK